MLRAGVLCCVCSDNFMYLFVLLFVVSRQHRNVVTNEKRRSDRSAKQHSHDSPQPNACVGKRRRVLSDANRRYVVAITYFVLRVVCCVLCVACCVLCILGTMYCGLGC